MGEFSSLKVYNVFIQLEGRSTMKKLLILLAVVGGLVILGVIAINLLTPWMDRWGATAAEIAATFPGDELVPAPASFVNRAITIQAPPEAIYPWIVQLDAEKGGWYSYDWLETNLLRCPMVNADRIHPEWQDRQVGDAVNMCPDGSGPPPYTVAQMHPNRAMVMGHQEGDKWVDLYQFVITPQADGSSRLILRTRTNMTGGIWDYDPSRRLHHGTRYAARHQGARRETGARGVGNDLYCL